MGEVVHVASPNDERLADYAALTDSTLRKRYEHSHGVLIAEGPNPVRELLSSPYPVRSLLVADRRLAEVPDLIARADAPVYVVPQDVLEELVRFRLHQGVLACGERLPPATPQAVLTAARTVLVLEGLGDHENLGTLFRSARALGVDAVLLGPGCADPLYRRSVRVSMGHVLHLPFARVDSVAELLTLLGDHGLTSLALTPDPAAPLLAERRRDRQERLALLLGAEGPGLSDELLTGADERRRIGMRDGLDSLNVAAAGAIACYALGIASPQGAGSWTS